MKSKKAFTLIELLVVIAIIGILTTVAVVALNNARAKARDAKRVADVKQIQTALELYYNDKGHYPTVQEFTSGSILSTSSSGTTTYMEVIPSAPEQLDGVCTAEQNTFVYNPSVDGSSYTIGYCVGGNVGGLAAGSKCATPEGVTSADCSAAAVVISTCVEADIEYNCPSGLTTADAGCYCGGGILFYVDLADNTYYLAAPSDWYGGGADPTAVWSSVQQGVYQTAIGIGRDNTAAMLVTDATVGIAPQLADHYSDGTYSDWYLPSRDELSLTYTNLGAYSLGGFFGTYYLSSSQSASGPFYMPYMVNFADGTVATPDFYYGSRYVRPIRSAVY
jgi:general secretion pathway protein G